MKTRFVIALLSCAIATPALAAGKGFFAGGSLGLVKNPDWVDAANQYMVANGATSADTRQNAYSLSIGVRGGYWLNDNFGVEGGLTGISEAKGTVTTTGAGIAGTTTYSYTTGIVYAAALGGLPLGKGTLFGKAGLYNASTELKGTTTITGMTVSSPTASNTGLLLGAGYAFRVMNHLSIRPEITLYNGVKFNNLDTTKSNESKNLYQLSVGADYMF
ncbi:MAG: outer membrane beta-barrel protein [Nitrosomonadales bacterium]|nr:outer membrane beta-barrel protein [Nitrosomonadales bacterium]